MIDELLNQNEIVLKNGPTTLVTSKLGGKPGKIFLTNERVIFTKKSVTLAVIFGALSKLSDGKLELEIPLKSITHISRCKIQFDSNMVCLHTVESKVYTFNLRFEEWFEAIKQALFSYDKSEVKEEKEWNWVIEKV